MSSEDYSLLDMYENAFPNSQKLYEKATTIFPNGVTHDSRYLQPHPIYVEKAKGSKKWDVDGKEYIDYWSGHGSLLLGHGPEEVVKAVTEQIALGTHLGACHRKEIEWGELVIDMVPSAEKVRFTSSGSEATLMAIRLSRTFAGKNKLLKFAGHFHGWHDQVILGANPPYETPPPAIIKGIVDTTVICPPNDIEAVEEILRTDNDIACVIIEPTGGSFGTIPMKGEFLKQVREVTSKYGVILISDEVISGFRVAPGGAQEYYNVTPDLTTLAKILAGGLPGGAVTGRQDIMALLENRKDPEWKANKKMPHPGTFNANPVSASAGIATLKIVKSGEPSQIASERGGLLRKGMNEVIDRHGLNWCVYGEFSEFRYLLGHDLPNTKAKDFDPYKYDYQKLKGANDPILSQNLRCGMLLNGVDSTAGGGMAMAAHTEEDIEKTVEAFDKTISWMKRDGLI